MEEKIKRIADANINRITEGLRVCEDVYRYSFDNALIQSSLKSLRHRFSVIIDRTPLISSRDSLNDVGLDSKGDREFDRTSLKDLSAANIKRAEEGLRVLEEVYKIENPDISSKMKQFRYELYDIEKKALNAFEIKKLEKGLYLVMTNPLQGYEKIAELAVRACIPAIQLRHKKDSDRKLMEISISIRKITEGSKTLFFINDRLDIAKLCNADGVHLGQDDVDSRMARDFLGDDFLIGLSTHNLKQVEDAQNKPVDYIGFGPVWATDSKETPDPVTGTVMLEEAVRMSEIPVVAIGGICRANIHELKGIGFNNIAVIRAVQDMADPYEEMRYLNSFQEA